MSSSTRSVTEVLSDTFSNLQEIFRAELQLAKTETRDKLRSARPAGVLVAVGALGACFGAFFILLCIVQALSLAIPIWAASLAVGVVVAIFGAVMMDSGVRRLRQQAHPPPKTIASLQEDVGTLKENVEWAKPRNR